MSQAARILRRRLRRDAERTADIVTVEIVSGLGRSADRVSVGACEAPAEASKSGTFKPGTRLPATRPGGARAGAPLTVAVEPPPGLRGASNHPTDRPAFLFGSAPEAPEPPEPPPLPMPGGQAILLGHAGGWKPGDPLDDYTCAVLDMWVVDDLAAVDWANPTATLDLTGGVSDLPGSPVIPNGLRNIWIDIVSEDYARANKWSFIRWVRRSEPRTLTPAPLIWDWRRSGLVKTDVMDFVGGDAPSPAESVIAPFVYQGSQIFTLLCEVDGSNQILSHQLYRADLDGITANFVALTGRVALAGIPGEVAPVLAQKPQSLRPA